MVTYSDIFQNFLQYSKENFTLLGIKIEYSFNGIEQYRFNYKRTSFLVLEYDGVVKDKILIDLNNEVKKLIRKRKINRILTKEINI